jgi:hypothetical protein
MMTLAKERGVVQRAVVLVDLVGLHEPVAVEGRVEERRAVEGRAVEGRRDRPPVVASVGDPGVEPVG